MPCYHPIPAAQHEHGGKLIFPPPGWTASQRGGNYKPLDIACGQCRGCRLKRSREWAIRCLHEKQMHRHNCYITLTYNDQHLPSDTSLRYTHFQRFIKRLRKALSRGTSSGYSSAILRTNEQNTRYGATPHAPLKFYMCGEYGELGRPHFHALLFGIDFADRLYWKKTPAGAKIYRSATLEKLWPFGFSSTAEVTFESAAYIARYVMKKRTGDGNRKNYQILNPDTGEIENKTKEFNQMSRRPGIGSSWLSKYAADIYTTGKVIIRNHKQNPPRYYDKLYHLIDAAALEGHKHARYLEALAQIEHHTPERLAVQEQVAAAKTVTLKRNLQ